MRLLRPLPRRLPRAPVLQLPRPSTYDPSFSPLSSRGFVDSDRFLLRCRWNPAQRQALDRRDGEIERDSEQTGHQNPRPGLAELRNPSVLEDLDAERVESAAEVLADDRADHGQHGRDFKPGEDERQRRRDAYPPEDLHLSRGVGLHQLERTRIHGRQPSQRVHHHREEAEDRDDADLRALVEWGEPDVRDRGERDDRNRTRRDCVRHECRAHRAPACKHEGDEDRESGAEHEAPERLLEREPALGPELSARVPERRCDRRGLREQELLHVERANQPLPEADRDGEYDQRGEPVGDTPADEAGHAAAREGLHRRRRRGHAGVLSMSWPRWSASRTSVTSSKKRGSSRVVAVRGCGRSTVITVEIRPGRGDITTTRVERKTASAMECVTKTTVDRLASQMRSSSMFIRSRVISSSAPNGSSMRSREGSNDNARAIATRCCMPPDSCQGWWFSKPVSSTRSSISFTFATRRRRFQRASSSGSAMFFPTVRQS